METTKQNNSTDKLIYQYPESEFNSIDINHDNWLMMAGKLLTFGFFYNDDFTLEEKLVLLFLSRNIITGVDSMRFISECTHIKIQDLHLILSNFLRNGVIYIENNHYYVNKENVSVRTLIRESVYHNL